MELRPDRQNRFERPTQPGQESLPQHARTMAETKARARMAMRRVSQAREHASEEMKALGRPAHNDTIDLSEAARAFTQDVSSDDGARQAFVQDLKAAYEQGALNTDERIERAAEKLIGG